MALDAKSIENEEACATLILGGLGITNNLDVIDGMKTGLRHKREHSSDMHIDAGKRTKRSFRTGKLTNMQCSYIHPV